MADETSHKIGDAQQQQESLGPPEVVVDLQGWSTRVEDLVDGGDEEGAVKLLEQVVESLQIRSDAAGNLSLAAALNDLGNLYATQGLSLKSDELFNAALVIKQRRAREPAQIPAGSWIEDPKRTPQHDRSVPPPSGPTTNRKDVNEHDQWQSARNSSEEPFTVGAGDEEDWETLMDELPTPVKVTSKPTIKEVHSNEKGTSKQRGRGSFTYGGTGMYSDNLDVSAQEDGQGNDSSQSDHLLDGGASHVLVLTFSPKTKTKDLEDLVKPFSKKGSCSVRWVNDTRALAVFSSPTIARDALAEINDPRYKVNMFSESNEIYGLTSVKDLAPPGPRPATTPRVAERMIARALSRQGAGQALVAKTKGSSKETRKQEILRKERLHSRAQLRDDAWGSD